jgi:hypothetical protein
MISINSSPQTCDDPGYFSNLTPGLTGALWSSKIKDLPTARPVEAFAGQQRWLVQPRNSLRAPQQWRPYAGSGKAPVVDSDPQ